MTEPDGIRITAYAYDAAGNRVAESITQDGSATVNAYNYDDCNRLISIDTKVDNVTTDATEYGYDNNGNQLTITVNGTVTAVNTYDEKDRLVWTTSGGLTVTNV